MKQGEGMGNRKMTWQLALLVWLGLTCSHAIADVKMAFQRYNAGQFAQALQLALPDARKGNARASALVGYLYMMGQGTTQNYKLAHQYLLKAAKAGQSSAQAHLGYLLREGLGIEKNPALALQYFRQASAQGNTYAQKQAANMLMLGQGIERDAESAVALINQAIDAGDTQASVMLATWIEEGLTQEQTPFQLLNLLRDAANKEDVHAHFRLGRLYLERKNTFFDFNVDTAAYHLERAANGGLRGPNLLLYFIHAGFFGTPKNLGLATTWLRNHQQPYWNSETKILREWVGPADKINSKDWPLVERQLKSAAASGDAISTHNLALLYRHGAHPIKPDPDKATTLMKNSAAAGLPESMVIFAKWQIAGEDGVEHDPLEAIPLLESAAEKGNVEALFELGKLYYEHIGDTTQGMDHIRRAAQLRHPMAQVFIGLAEGRITSEGF